MQLIPSVLRIFNAFRENHEGYPELLATRRGAAEAVPAGGEQAAWHVARGKMTLRERAANLLDPGSRLLKIGAIAACLMTLLAAWPVVAQDEALTADTELSEICFENAGLRFEQGDDPDWQSCVGLASDVCMRQPGGDTTVGMTDCIGSEYQFWDRKLNQIYQIVLSIAESMDQQMADLGSAAEQQAPALRQMQRDWIAYRDSACRYERSRWGGGTGGGPASANCMLELAARQVFWLQQYLLFDQGR